MTCMAEFSYNDSDHSFMIETKFYLAYYTNPQMPDILHFSPSINILLARKCINQLVNLYIYLDKQWLA